MAAYAAELLELEVPVILAGDYNVMPTELDVYKPERWIDDAMFRIEVREAYRELVEQGWTDALRELNPGKRIYTFWHYFRNSFARDAGLRIDHFLLSPSLAKRLKKGGRRQRRQKLGAYKRPRPDLDRVALAALFGPSDKEAERIHRSSPQSAFAQNNIASETR